MRLTSVTANRHFFDGRANGRPLSLLLEFEGKRRVRLGVAGDGQEMTLDDRPLDEPFDMAEYGTVAIEDVTHSLFARLRDSEVREARVLRLDGQRLGLRLLLAGHDAFHFWVDGDELFWGDEKALAAHWWLDGRVPEAGEPIDL